ncbi:MAG: hypothetical protein QOJ75_213, partial [Chloroflexota bacterium]|nr:hypothetical protein [Chloroflexota bacterium]
MPAMRLTLPGALAVVLLGSLPGPASAVALT